MRLSASLLALFLALSSAAQAENPRLAAAIRLYQRAELDAATAELKAAEEQSKDEGDLVQILIYRGLVFAETGQQQQMAESFKRALAMRPWADVPQETSPRLAKMFQDARREVWGSPGIKPWPKKAAGHTDAAPKTEPTPAPAQPAPHEAAPAAPTEAPAAKPAPDAPAAGDAAKPSDASPSSDAPPDVPPSTP